MSDIVERAEEVLRWTRTSATNRTLSKLVPELVAELKSARAENEHLRADAEMWHSVQSMYSGGSDADKSAPQFPGTGLGPQG